MLVDADAEAAARIGDVLASAIERQAVERLVAQPLAPAEDDGLERPTTRCATTTRPPAPR
jgi:hypothetical protein